MRLEGSPLHREKCSLRIATLVSLLVSVSCQASSLGGAPTAPPAREDSELEYRIRPGDRLTIRVVNHPEHGVKRAEVAPDGTIEVPRHGRVQVSGLTSAELGRLIQRKIRESRAHRSVIVIVEEIERAK